MRHVAENCHKIETFKLDMSLSFSHHPRKEAYLNFVDDLRKLKVLKKLYFTLEVHKFCRQYCMMNISELFDLVFGSMKGKGLEMMHLEGCFYHVKETFSSTLEDYNNNCNNWTEDEDSIDMEE